MQPVAIITVARPDIDTVIVWDRADSLVAFAYHAGTVKLTRPLAASTLDDALAEVRDQLAIDGATVIRLQDWNATHPVETLREPGPRRWSMR